MTRLKSSLPRGEKPSFTVFPGSKTDSDITRLFVTDIAFSILVKFADDECAEEEEVESRKGFFMHSQRVAQLSRALQFEPNPPPLQKTLLLIPSPLGRP